MVDILGDELHKWRVIIWVNSNPHHTTILKLNLSKFEPISFVRLGELYKSYRLDFSKSKISKSYDPSSLSGEGFDRGGYMVKNQIYMEPIYGPY